MTEATGLVRRPERAAARELRGSARSLARRRACRTAPGLRRRYDEWRWGRAHVAEFANPVFGRIAVLRDWLAVSIPTSGAFDTLDRGPSTIRDEHAPFVQRFGAGLRVITDLASPQASRMIAVPGQSGNPLSRPLRRSAAALAQFRLADPRPRHRPSATLTLEPAQMNDLPVIDRRCSPRRRGDRRGGRAHADDPRSPALVGAHRAPRSFSNSRTCIAPARSRNAARSTSS